MLLKIQWCLRVPYFYITDLWVFYKMNFLFNFLYCVVLFVVSFWITWELADLSFQEKTKFWPLSFSWRLNSTKFKEWQRRFGPDQHFRILPTSWTRWLKIKEKPWCLGYQHQFSPIGFSYSVVKLMVGIPPLFIPNVIRKVQLLFLQELETLFLEVMQKYPGAQVSKKR